MEPRAVALALLAVLAPQLLYFVLKRRLATPVPEPRPRSAEDWDELRRLYHVAQQRRGARFSGPVPPASRLWLRLLSSAVTLTLLYALVAGRTTTEAPSWVTTNPPLSHHPQPPALPAPAGVTELLLGFEPPGCSWADRGEYCFAEPMGASHDADGALFVDEEGGLHFSAQGGLHSEASVVTRLQQLVAGSALRCVCAWMLPEVGRDLGFLVRAGRWVVLYAPTLTRNGTRFTQTRLRFPPPWQHLSGTVQHSTELAIEFEAPSFTEDALSLLRSYNARLRRANLAPPLLLRRLVPALRERLPLRLSGEEAACFSYCGS